MSPSYYTDPRPGADNGGIGRFLAVTAVVGAVAWTGIALMGSVAQHPVAVVMLYVIAFFAYFLAVRRMIGRQQVGRSLTLILIVGLLYRALAFGGSPSDDMSRYLWEGEIQRSGHNPYALAPNTAELASLRENDPNYPLINHKSWTAIYPPVIMLWHRVFGQSAATLKASFLFAEGLLVLFLWLLLRSRQVNPDRLLIYWWNPLPIFSFSLEGHHDVVSIAFLLAAFYILLGLGKERSAIVAWAAAVLSKGFALAAGPAFWGQIKPRAWLWVLLFVAAVYFPFLDAGPALWRSLLRFGGELHYNDSLHALFAAGLGIAGIEAPFWSRLLSVLTWFGILIWVLRRVRPDPLLRAAWLLGALLLVLPTVHPWYLTTLLPLLCFFPWPGWILLTGTCVLPFLAQIEIASTGEWVEWHVLKLPEYAPLFGWLLWTAMENWRLRSRATLSLFAKQPEKECP